MPGSDSLSAPHWRAEEGVPSSPLSCLYVPRSLRRGVLNGCASQGFTASMAFAVNEQARLPLVPLVAGRLSTPQTSRDATDRRFARLLSSRCQRASTGGSRRPPPLSYPAAGPLPGPDFHRLAQRGLSGRTHSGRRPAGARCASRCLGVGSKQLAACYSDLDGRRDLAGRLAPGRRSLERAGRGVWVAAAAAPRHPARGKRQIGRAPV